MSKQVQLLVKPENTSGPVELKLYAGHVCLNVRDLTTRAIHRVRAEEISCYLHTLFLGGIAYQILNVVKLNDH